MVAEYAAQLNKREAEMGITPDPELAAMTEAEAVHGKRHTISTDLMLRILGLEAGDMGSFDQCTACGVAAPRC